MISVPFLAPIDLLISGTITGFTIPSCPHAIVTMRQLFAFFRDLQRAFYSEAVDITKPEVYSSLLTPYELE